MSKTVLSKTGLTRYDWSSYSPHIFMAPRSYFFTWTQHSIFKTFSFITQCHSQHRHNISTESLQKKKKNEYITKINITIHLWIIVVTWEHQNMITFIIVSMQCVKEYFVVNVLGNNLHVYRTIKTKCFS